MKLFLTLLGVALALPLSAKPNVVVILADDLGYSDLASYGSEINTPNIDSLAQAGIRFSNYHTASSCAPSRAMLLTGVDSHKNGVPNIPEAIPPGQNQQANYQGTLGHNVVTTATLLQDAGYHTYMAGKWHLGHTPDLLPYRRGFERSLTMALTGADNWEQKPYLPIYDKAHWYADGEPTLLPEGFYSSELLVDKTIEFIDSNKDDGKPFFTYLPFTAVHIPVQAPAEYTAKYLGQYDAGWGELRKSRLAGAQAQGIVPPGVAMDTMNSTVDWDSLTADEQRYNAKAMAVYAGMIDAMDTHIGRLISYLKSIDAYDNTIFIFTSDNGAEGSEGLKGGFIADQFLATMGYHANYEGMGEKGSFLAIGPSWASAAASPLAYFKFYSSEGGMRVPLIIAGNNIKNPGSINTALTYVTDLAPTILQLTNVEHPGNRYGGKPIESMTGKSLVGLLNDQVKVVRQPLEVLGFELGGNTALFQGDYKIVLNIGPFADKQWHLYNVVKDPGETVDLRNSDKQVFSRMMAAYESYIEQNQVLAVPDGYQQTRQVFINGFRDRSADSILRVILTLLFLLPFLVAWRLRKKTTAQGANQ